MYQEWFKEYEKLKNENKRCKCCEEIEFIKNMNKIGTDTRNIKREVKAILTTISKRKGEKPSGRIDYNLYNLNYCPMCGRKLGE